jgi:hypothetical protein
MVLPATTSDLTVYADIQSIGCYFSSHVGFVQKAGDGYDLNIVICTYTIGISIWFTAPLCSYQYLTATHHGY